MLTAPEQFFLELTNHARLNPRGAAEKVGIGLNDDLAPGTISGDPMQALAPNSLLGLAAERHSQWMLENNVFAHEGDPALRDPPDYPGSSSHSTASNPGERMAAAGYDFNAGSWWTWGENIAFYASTGSLDIAETIERHYVGLFKSAGHRENTLNAAFREAGVADEIGGFTHQGVTYSNTSMLTNKFATAGNGTFLTGVVYSDTDSNGFYSIGEGTGGIGFSASGQSVQTWAAGGYVLELAPTDSLDVTVTAGGVQINATVDLSQGNAKLDLVNGAELQSSVDLTLGDGAVSGSIIGSAGRVLTGNADDNHLRGGQGDDTIIGGGGYDIVHYDGARADYTVSTSGGVTTVTHNVASALSDGTDQLRNIEEISFADSTHVLSAPGVLQGVVHLPEGHNAAAQLSLAVAGISDPVVTGAGANGEFTLNHGGGAAELSIEATAPAGQVTVSDAIDVLFMAIGLNPGFEVTAHDFVAADVSGDGKVTVSDAIDVLFHAVGMNADLPVGNYVFVAEGGVPDDQTVGAVHYDDGLSMMLETGTTNMDIYGIQLGNLGVYADYT